ncbi:MAG: cell division protein FtsZ [Omnitrophica WOR_2 bacterium]
MNPFESLPSYENDFSGPVQPVIKVMGLGGGGSNAVNRMIELGISGVEFICANTDHQALESCLAPVKIQLGPKTTRGLGAGGTPAIGKAAAEESFREIAAALDGADMVFLTAGMGGGTGTGSIPVTAKIARATGAVTIAVVTTPFSFEMGRRQRNATEGLAALRPNTDTLISIPNDRLLYVAPRNLPMETAFRMADDVLRQAVQGITELITEPGMINVDFAHIHHLMKLGGGALMSIGQGEGENKAQKAIENALYHPLLESTSLENARGILVNFTAGQDLTLFEVEAALTYLQKQTGSDAEIVLGVINDNRMEERVQVILVVTGLGALSLEETLHGYKPAAQVPVQTPEPVLRELAPQPAAPVTRTVPLSNSQNLDIPSFLRRAR